MATTQEILAKLGIDSSQVPKDLNNAKGFFDKFGKDVEQSGAKHGEGFGEHFGGAIAKKLGAHHLGNAIASALGINIEKIAESIASAIVGGSKEGWEEAGRIADETTKIMEQNLEKRLTPKQLGDRLKKELERAYAEAASVKGDKVYGGEDSNGAAIYKEAALNAEQLKKRNEALKTAAELEGKIADLQRDETKQIAEYVQARKEFDGQHLEGQEKINALVKEQNDTLAEIVKGGLTEGQIAEKKKHLLELEGKIIETNKEMAEKAAAEQKKANEEEEAAIKKQIEQEKKLADLKLTKAQQERAVRDDKNKQADRSKLTIAEAADITNKKVEDPFKSNLDLSYGSDSDLTADQKELKRKAKEVKEAEEKIEELRRAGRTGEAAEALTKLDSMRGSLVEGGFIKSTEDPSKALAEQLSEDTDKLNKTLTEIRDLNKGIFKNQ